MGEQDGSTTAIYSPSSRSLAHASGETTRRVQVAWSCSCSRQKGRTRSEMDFNILYIKSHMSFDFGFLYKIESRIIQNGIEMVKLGRLE